MPRRVKVEGDLYHGRVPAGAVYVGRGAPGLPASPFANPFSVKTYGREDAIGRYRERLLSDPDLLDRARRELAGNSPGTRRQGSRLLVPAGRPMPRRCPHRGRQRALTWPV